MKTHYAFLNKIVKSDGIVLWGSTTLSSSLFNELLQDLDMPRRIYNRSIERMTIAEAEKYLELCVFDLKPEKVILNLGEEDLSDSANVAQLIEQYRWILYKIHITLPSCRLIITSIQNKSAAHEAFNRELEKLAAECGCTFYRIPDSTDDEEYGLLFLRTIKLSLYPDNMSNSDIASKVLLSLMVQ